MSNSPNRYLEEPQLAVLSSNIVSVSESSKMGIFIACEETIFRPNSGGQPVDYGSLIIGGESYRVANAKKANGMTYLFVPDLDEKPESGLEILQRIDLERRNQLSKLHTLQHLVSAELARRFPCAAAVGTGISHNAEEAWLKLTFNDPMELCKLTKVDRGVRSNVLAELPVTISKEKSLEHASLKFGNLFRQDSNAKLSGKVRVVKIAGVDANCCSGTHWESSNVGPYAMGIESEVTQSGYDFTIRVKLMRSWNYWFGE